MAGVDHAYQYSVEVKSRFSLFMDDSLNNEDPDILMSKLQNERVVRAKKDKANALPIVKPEKKVEKDPEMALKSDKPQTKNQPIVTLKLQKSSPQQSDENNDQKEQQEKSATAPAQNVFRGRSGPRGFGRFYRGGRGQAPRAYQGEFQMNGSDSPSTRNGVYDHRGRERFRPRGGFYRSRPMNTDVRELPVQPDTDSHGQQVNRGDGAPPSWSTSPVENDLTNATTEDASVTENHDNSKGEEKTDEEKAHTYTLEEYKAMRSLEKPSVTLAFKGTRKPNDGEDVFANMVAHRKIVEVVEDEYVKVEMEEEQPEIEINVLFNDELGGRGRNSRGYNNRGFIRGGRARGRPRMDRGGRGTFRGDARGHRGTPRVIYNDQEFPSLK